MIYASTCSECPAACCRSVVVVSSLTLGRDEVRWLELHGAEIEGHAVTLPLRCLSLGDDDRCRIYDDRPLLCAVFTPGSHACHRAQDWLSSRKETADGRHA